MERVAFLVEATDEHITCLLNPESLVVSRTAGVRPRQAAGGLVTGAGLADDPVLLAGGGRTVLQLDLLFDVDLVDPLVQPPDDVRQLTAPLSQLAENSDDTDGIRRPPTVRFVWGRAWNLPGVVTEVSERFDRFSDSGMPLRSWLRMAFLRTGTGTEPTVGDGYDGYDAATAGSDIDPDSPASRAIAIGPSGAAAVNPVQLGLMSLDAFGTPLMWKSLMSFNGVDDPLRPGGPLDVPEIAGRPA